MGNGDRLLGGNSAMDQHPIQGGVAILLSLLYANETGISSGRLGLWLVCAFTYITLDISKRLKLPQDDRTDTNFIAPLRMHSQRSKSTLVSLKSVFCVCRRKPSLVPHRVASELLEHTPTVSSQQLYIPFYRTNIKKFSPTIIGRYVSNDLPLSICSRLTKKLFKNSVFSHY